MGYFPGMLVLHTTEKLRRRWKLKVHSPDILPGPQPLRHWQVSTFPACGKTWVLFLEGQSYWPVLVQFGPWKSVVTEFHRRACLDFVAKGANPRTIEEFEAWGGSHAIQASQDRRIIGVWNEFAFHAQLHLDHGDGQEHAVKRIQGCPTGALKEAFPTRALEKLLSME
jgi:hypothetical protein